MEGLRFRRIYATKAREMFQFMPRQGILSCCNFGRRSLAANAGTCPFGARMIPSIEGFGVLEEAVIA